MATTLHEVARRAGVSAITVSRVVNGRGSVGSETRQRVEEAIQALDYVPNRIARGLISQKTQTIGIVVPDIVNPFFRARREGGGKRGS
jgi:LacI family transcriptional regulator